MNRRNALRLALAALLLPALPWPAAAIEMQVTVQRRDEVVVIDARLLAPVSPPEAWAVLTDFNAMSGFVPNLDASLVTARDGERLRVEQRGVARWGPFARSFTTVREVELEPMTLVRSRSVGGSLGAVTSQTHFEAAVGGTEVRHHIEWRLDTWLPDFVVEPLLRHEVREQFEAVVGEMVRRRTSAR
jgi:hypothetical protein